jgi:hypothetical protein
MRKILTFVFDRGVESTPYFDLPTSMNKVLRNNCVRALIITVCLVLLLGFFYLAKNS